MRPALAATVPEGEGMDVVRRPALTVSWSDVLRPTVTYSGSRPISVLIVIGLLRLAQG